MTALADTVSVSQAESTLAALRREAALSKDADNAFPDIRAAVATLVIWCGRSAEEGPAGAVGSLVAGHHTCRMVLVVPGEGPVKADVSAQCTIAGSFQVCTEAVTLRGGTPGQAASAVEQVLLSNVPVVVWSLGGLLPDDASRLYHAADRVLYDSDAGVPVHDIARLQAEAAIQRTWAADLAWTRLTPWRALMASFFDLPVALPLLHELRAVRVTWSLADDLLAPWLLAGWVLDRVRRRPPDVTVSVDRGNPAFVLDCGREAFHVEATPGGLAAWRTSDADLVRHVATPADMPGVQLARDVADELAQVRPDPAFAGALATALEIAGTDGR